jgi:hypothetical protein
MAEADDRALVEQVVDGIVDVISATRSAA